MPGAMNTLSRLIDLKNGVHKWWDDLPGDVFCKEPTRQSQIRRSDMHLHLEYCLVRMFTGRPFILPRFRSRNNTGSGVIRSPSTDSSTADSRSILASDCVAAALAVVDTCKVLKETIGLARASYTEFSACRAALLVIIAQCLQERTDRLRQYLGDGLAMIKVMSAGGESARSEASLIEVFERAISRLYPVNYSVDSESVSDYTRFKQWETLWRGNSPNEPQPRPNLGPAMAPASTNLREEAAGSTRLEAVQQATSSVAIDWNFPPLPQDLDEFSSMFGQRDNGESNPIGSYFYNMFT